MRIVIDLQAVQGGSRQRGIGRYAQSLALAIARHRGQHEIILAVNGVFTEAIDAIYADFADLLPPENIRLWQTPAPVTHLDPANTWRRSAAELLREAFLASLNPDVVLVGSLFEGFDNNVVCSIGKFSASLPTAVILYDLIPLINRETYLSNPLVQAWYDNKLADLQRADLLLAISESSRQEATQYLTVPSDKCINISAAVDPQFQPQKIAQVEAALITSKYGVMRPFLLYTGGDDLRKNIDGLIRAYAKLSQSLRTTYQLVIVCKLSLTSEQRLVQLIKQLGLSADEVILTGFVPDDELVTLYQHCVLLVFPSFHEGFGLPVLEAMSCGKAVIGSNTSSLPEVIGREDALFDPKDEASIAEKMAQVLSDEDFRRELEQHSLTQAKRFSWDATAIAAIKAMECLHSKKTEAAVAIVSPCRPKLAYVSPFPPEQSGISYYSAELLPELASYYDIDLILNQDTVLVPEIDAGVKIRTIAWFKAHAHQYDRVLYHFGNSSFHQHMFALLGEIPGVVVLHDFFLSGIVAHMEMHGGLANHWSKALYESHGYKALAARYQKGSKAHEVIMTYPCNRWVLRQALNIIVHSRHAKELAETWYGASAATSWALVPHLRALSLNTTREEARIRLKFQQDDFIVCSFGLLGPTKLNHRLLSAWLSSSLAANGRCFLIFAGDDHGSDYGLALRAQIKQSGLAERIHITQWLDTEAFQDYLAAADLAVQLRTCSRGESSGTVLDCMSHGLACIVNKEGSLAELPEDAVCFLSKEFSDEQLKNALEGVWQDKAYRQTLGHKAREVIVSQHSPKQCAKGYVQAIESSYVQAATVLPQLISAISCLDPIQRRGDSIRAVAQAIAESIPAPYTKRQLLVDISVLTPTVRNLLEKLLYNPPDGFYVEPVYFSAKKGYRYARRFTQKFLGCPEWALADELIDFHAGDVFLRGEFDQRNAVLQQAFLRKLRHHGVKIISDLLSFTYVPGLTRAVSPPTQQTIEKKTPTSIF